MTAGTPFDLDGSVPGAETTPLEAACREGQRVVLRGAEGVRHDPTVSSDVAARVLGTALRD